MIQLNTNKVSNICQAVDRSFLKIFEHTLPAGVVNNKLPASSDRGFVFVASFNSGVMEQKTIWTRKALKIKAGEQYVTASAFYRPDQGRNKKNLRWINAIVLDFDGQQDPHDLALRIADAGLPPASMMVNTPSGGIHVWWFLKPVRGTPKAVRLYEALQSSLAAELGADPAAVGAERLWRLPTAANVIYSSSKRYKLSVFRNWRDENRPEDMPGKQQTGQVYAFTRGLLREPAIAKLLHGVPKGGQGVRGRDDACFALAVAHLLSGYSVIETEQILLTWNQLNSPPLADKDVYKCVKSAAKGLQKDFLHYYNAMRLKAREITNINIKYRPITPAKPREERKRSHIAEWTQDIVKVIQKRGGKLCTKQTELAELLNAPLRSIKAALKLLNITGKVIIKTIKRGRRSITILILRDQEKESVHSGTHYGTAGVSSTVGSDVFLSFVLSCFRGRLVL